MKISLKRNLREFLQSSQTEPTVDAISAYFFENLGAPLQTDAILLSHKNNIWVKRCAVKNTAYQVLFTTGLSGLTGLEIYLVLPLLPQAWPIRRFNERPFIEESFPVDFLSTIVQLVERKNSGLVLEEGVTFSRDKPGLAKLGWDKRAELISGFVLLDHQWGIAVDYQAVASEDVKLLALAPYGSKEKANLAIVKQRAKNYAVLQQGLSWEQLSLPFNPDILPYQKLQQGFDEQDFALIKQAVLEGADPNRRLVRLHQAFGYYQAEPLLLEAMRFQDEDLLRFLVENGAQVAVHAIASLGSWGNRSLVEFLLAHGADLNASSCGMTALMRAKAFKNHDFEKTLLELGATA